MKARATNYTQAGETLSIPKFHWRSQRFLAPCGDDRNSVGHGENYSSLAMMTKGGGKIDPFAEWKSPGAEKLSTIGDL
jgi:hypothetical protein